MTAQELRDGCASRFMDEKGPCGHCVRCRMANALDALTTSAETAELDRDADVAELVALLDRLEVAYHPGDDLMDVIASEVEGLRAAVGTEEMERDALRAQLAEARSDASELAHYLAAVLGPYPDPAHARIAAVVNRVMDQG